ncbi:MAG: CoA pyrophosphatase [Ignavibacteriae bacterium]|nr:CoA pyrophosphatase [Ignavibacteriota bacterium]
MKNNINNGLEFIDFLNDRLTKPLPGYLAHSQMQPLLKGKQFRTLTPKDDTYPSAVLVLLRLNEEINELEVLLTLRSNNIRHSGQISCPGGFVETGEEPVVTALREAREEIGLETDNLVILGTLSELYVQPSNTLITPILAFSKFINDLEINKQEVEEVFFIQLKTLLDERVFNKETWNLQGNDVEVPFWKVHQTTPLWGATAMILEELLFLYKEFNNLL